MSGSQPRRNPPRTSRSTHGGWQHWSRRLLKYCVRLQFVSRTFCARHKRLKIPETQHATMKQRVIVPFSSPLRSIKGQDQHQVQITKGTIVVLGMQATNRHRGLWGDDADEWKPERWLSPLPQELIDARIPGVYSHLMTFQGGTKSCIGFKFAEIEMKVILSVLLEKFGFSRSKKEIYWNMAFITFPTVGKIDDKSQLPLVVRPLIEE